MLEARCAGISVCRDCSRQLVAEVAASLVGFGIQTVFQNHNSLHAVVQVFSTLHADAGRSQATGNSLHVATLAVCGNVSNSSVNNAVNSHIGESRSRESSSDSQCDDFLLHLNNLLELIFTFVSGLSLAKQWFGGFPPLVRGARYHPHYADSTFVRNKNGMCIFFTTARFLPYGKGHQIRLAPYSKEIGKVAARCRRLTSPFTLSLVELLAIRLAKQLAILWVKLDSLR